MNEPMTPEQFAELKEALERQLHELSEEDLAALSLVPDAASGSTKGQS